MVWFLASVAVVVCGGAAAWLLLGPLARRAARPYITATTTPADDLETLTKIRGVMLQAAQGVVVVGGVLFTAGTLLYTATSIRLTQDGQITDRYTSAIENLGSTNMEVRIGGMYALERIADNSPKDKPTVVRVLAAFVRDHGRDAAPILDDEATAIDVLQAVAHTPENIADLTGAHLPGFDPTNKDLRMLNLTSARLRGANLFRANLTGANLYGEDLRGANLTAANLGGANLTAANLTGANLTGAYLTAANLYGANLTGAYLTAANLSGAFLYGADLTGADLRRANLTGADLTGANLYGADLTGANLTGADLTGATNPDGTKHH